MLRRTEGRGAGAVEWNPSLKSGQTSRNKHICLTQMTEESQRRKKKQKEIFRVDVATVRMFLNHRQEGTAAIYSSWTWADTRIQELGTVIMSRTHDSQMKQGRSCPSGSADCWDTGGAGVSTVESSMTNGTIYLLLKMQLKGLPDSWGDKCTDHQAWWPDREPNGGRMEPHSGSSYLAFIRML